MVCDQSKNHLIIVLKIKMINKKCQLRPGKKVHGLVTMHKYKTTCPKWLKGFFLCLSKMGLFLPKFLIKKITNSNSECHPSLTHVAKIAKSQPNLT
jgi:hypothetical protein